MSTAAPLPETRPSCFHCGLPVPADASFEGDVLGERREFCCAGCRAVAVAIAEDGLGDYYRLRTAPAPTPEPDEPPDADALFDRPEAAAEFVRAEGPLSETTLFLDGVRCPACLWLNESRLRAIEGVAEAEASYAGQTVRVRWDPARLTLSEILAAPRRIGYRARPIDPSHRRDVDAEARRRDAARLLFAGLVGMMVMNLAIAAYLLGGAGPSGALPPWEAYARWTCLLASAALLLYPGREFFAGAWRDLANRRAGMDVPIAIGLSAAFAGSAAATVKGSGPVYYDAIGMLVPAVLLARAFETRARSRAAALLDRFAVVSPARAWRLDGAGRETEVAPDALSPGDLVRVRPGEAVPADGVLLDEAELDEAVLTGEAWPRRRAAGETVASGSVPRGRAASVRVTARAEDSALGQIRRLLERGVAGRPPFVAAADRAAAALVRIVLVAAAGTLAWRLAAAPPTALPATIAVLIVTCPCALALAAPVALALTAGRLIRGGIVSARAGALERLASADTAVFDKTGTLTTGAPALSWVAPFGGLDSGRALRRAAVLEAGSAHPAARALVAAGGSPGPAPGEAAEETPGGGVAGRVDGSRWWIGSPEFAFGGAPEEAAASALARANAAGLLPIVLSDRSGRGAVFALAETPREGAGRIVAALREDGLRCFALLSGDSPERVARLGRELGFDEARGAMRVEDKLAWVRERERAGHRVLFVGDGWNDAPTLAAASVSVSLAEAPRLPRLSGDFLLLGGDLGALAQARRLARRARRVLAQNVAWALGYNVLAVPLAAAGLVPPWAAALGMSASSLLVVANALRMGESASNSPAITASRASRAAGARTPPPRGRGR